jgi:hypothetical protein
MRGLTSAATTLVESLSRSNYPMNLVAADMRRLIPIGVRDSRASSRRLRGWVSMLAPVRGILILEAECLRFAATFPA